MKITASCVRCGKKIDGSKGIYCNACATAPMDVTQTPKDHSGNGKGLFICAIILLIGAVAAYALLGEKGAPGGADSEQAGDSAARQNAGLVADAGNPAADATHDQKQNATEQKTPGSSPGSSQSTAAEDAQATPAADATAPAMQEDLAPPEELAYSIEEPEAPKPMGSLGDAEKTPEKPSISAPEPEQEQATAAADNVAEADTQENESDTVAARDNESADNTQSSAQEDTTQDTTTQKAVAAEATPEEAAANALESATPAAADTEAPPPRCGQARRDYFPSLVILRQGSRPG